MNRQTDELSPERRPEEGQIEGSLRPRRLEEFIGQDKLKENLSVFLAAARGRGEPLDHLLLYGPPGLGKTTIAHIVATEMGTTLHVTSGPAIERPGDLVGVLTNLEPGAVLFIDEIHRLSRPVEEILYPAMEDRKVDILIGKGPAARSIRLDLPAFTVVGATTRQGLLTGPLRDRFGIVSHFQFYDRGALFQIVTRSGRILGYSIEHEGAEEIARRARGTPRIANRLLRRVRDFAQVDGLDTITRGIADKALDALEVDHLGLDRVDRQILSAIIDKYGGGPVGLAAAPGVSPVASKPQHTLAAALADDMAAVNALIANHGEFAVPALVAKLGNPDDAEGQIQAIAALKTAAVATATELDAAQGATAIKSAALGLVTETDLAQVITAGGVALGQAVVGVLALGDVLHHGEVLEVGVGRVPETHDREVHPDDGAVLADLPAPHPAESPVSPQKHLDTLHGFAALLGGDEIGHPAPQQFLHGFQVAGGFQQMGGEGMAQHVWVHMHAQSGGAGGSGSDFLHLPGADAPPQAAGEQRRLSGQRADGTLGQPQP